MIIFIVFSFIGNSLYATSSYVKEHNSAVNVHQSPFYEYKHNHEHIHSNSNNSHQHSHSHVNIHFLDFYIKYDADSFSNLELKEEIPNTYNWLSQPILDSLFRPPIV